MNTLFGYLGKSWETSSNCSKVVSVTAISITLTIFGIIGYDRMTYPLAYDINAYKNTNTKSISIPNNISNSQAIQIISTTTMGLISNLPGGGKNTSLSAKDVYGEGVIGIMSQKVIQECIASGLGPAEDCMKGFSYLYNKPQ